MRSTKDVILELLTERGAMRTEEIERAVSWWREPFVLGSLIWLNDRRMVKFDTVLFDNGNGVWAHNLWSIETSGRQRLIESKKAYVPFWQRAFS